MATTLFSIADELLTAVGMPTTRLSTAARRIGRPRHDATLHFISRMVAMAALFWPATRGAAKARDWIWSLLFFTVQVKSTDPAYQWIRNWLTLDGRIHTRIHKVILSTIHPRQQARHSTTSVREYNPDIVVHPVWQISEVQAQLKPCVGEDLWIRQGMRWIHVAHHTATSAGLRHRSVYEISTFRWNRDLINSFLNQGYDAFFNRYNAEMAIFFADGHFSSPIYRMARPWSSVILPVGTKEAILEDMKTFLSPEQKRWYHERGISHRRGYLLCGTPGSGKTTLVSALATKLKLDMYIINPSARDMCDAKLLQLFRSCPPRSMIVIEDIDVVMPTKRDSPSADLRSSLLSATSKGGSIVTLSGLLNAIDGLTSQESCVLVATTNHIDRLDHALVRAGRFDIKVELGYATAQQAHDLFIHFYSDAGRTKPSPSSDAVPSTTLAIEQAPAKIVDPAELAGLATTFASLVLPAATDTEEAEETEVEPLNISMSQLQAYLLPRGEDPVQAVTDARPWVEEMRCKQLKKAELNRKMFEEELLQAKIEARQEAEEVQLERTKKAKLKRRMLEGADKLEEASRKTQTKEEKPVVQDMQDDVEREGADTEMQQKEEKIRVQDKEEEGGTNQGEHGQAESPHPGVDNGAKQERTDVFPLTPPSENGLQVATTPIAGETEQNSTAEQHEAKEEVKSEPEEAKETLIVYVPEEALNEMVVKGAPPTPPGSV